jgi:hypothetical protein
MGQLRGGTGAGTGAGAGRGPGRAVTGWQIWRGQVSRQVSGGRACPDMGGGGDGESRTLMWLLGAVLRGHGLRGLLCSLPQQDRWSWPPTLATVPEQKSNLCTVG